ncbi:MAG: TonB family protein, partial [Methyloceanibacter sp.]|uniref:energy transducer TonB family protein n=2 Tax=Methyloceanibacter sp. TaxID=1965321 RepID=UPI003C518C54
LMALSVVAWLVSIAVHGLLVLALFVPVADGAALEEGTGSDIMVVEQGVAIEGIAKLGEDVVSVEAVEAPPMMSSVAQPLEQVEAIEDQQELPVEDVPEVQPVQDMVLASETGPESELVQPPEELLNEPEPEVEEQEIVAPIQEPVKEPELDLKEQPLPQQIAAVAQQTVITMRASSGEELRGGDATAHRAYLGKLRTHLEGSKVNPRTKRVGTAVVRLTVNSNGKLVSNEIVKSSGSKKLDNAALASIANAAPFPSIPSEVGQETISVSVPFRFKVR